MDAYYPGLLNGQQRKRIALFEIVGFCKWQFADIVQGLNQRTINPERVEVEIVATPELAEVIDVASVAYQPC